jgi:hypothetical protein
VQAWVCYYTVCLQGRAAIRTGTNYAGAVGRLAATYQPRPLEFCRGQTSHASA